MDTKQFPSTSPYASFVGPIDTSILRIKFPSFWPEGQERASGFIRLGTYLIPAPTGIMRDKGVFPFHIFVLFPLTIQPWQSMCAWMKNPKGEGPFNTRNWLSGSGPVLSILNREVVEDSEQRDDDRPILVLIPDTWDWIPSSSGDGVGGENINSASKQSNSTTPNKGSRSRNPFSSPSTTSKSTVKPDTGTIPIEVIDSGSQLYATPSTSSKMDDKPDSEFMSTEIVETNTRIDEDKSLSRKSIFSQHQK
jgi:hypothetical protein